MGLGALKLRERGSGIGFGTKSVRRVRVCSVADGSIEDDEAKWCLEKDDTGDE